MSKFRIIMLVDENLYYLTAAEYRDEIAIECVNSTNRMPLCVIAHQKIDHKETKTKAAVIDIHTKKKIA